MPPPSKGKKDKSQFAEELTESEDEPNTKKKGMKKKIPATPKLSQAGSAVSFGVPTKTITKKSSKKK